MVLACESIFSRTSLDGRPQTLHTFLKVNLKYTKRTFPSKQDVVFTCPTAIIYKFYLPEAMRQAPMSSPAEVSGDHGPIDDAPLFKCCRERRLAGLL